MPLTDDAYLLLAPRGAEFGLVALLLTMPLLLIAWLYRYELRLVRPGQAIGLLALRLVLVLVVTTTIGLRPQLTSIAIEDAPSRVRIAVDLSSSMDVVDSQRSAEESAALARTLKISANVNALTRKQIAARLLASDGANLLSRLAERHEVEVIGFNDRVITTDATSLFKEEREVRATDFAQAFVDDAGTTKAPLLGIILLTDGQHNVGKPPFVRAVELGRQRTPILPVVVGSRDAPNDLMIREVDAKAEAARNAIVPVEVRMKVANLPPQELMVELQFDGKPVSPEHRKVIAHDGTDKTHPVSFQVKLEEIGTHPYQIRATSKAGKEITLENNVAKRVLRVANDKAKVLLVDGEARWEYHYLANALRRDPEVDVERIVFTQPRIGAIKPEELDKAGFAKTKMPEVDKDGVDPLSAYDCVFLGDVAPEQLPPDDRKRVEKYVAERGGTLIFIAGKRHLPLDYLKELDDPLAKLLPIIEPRVLNDNTGFTLRLTSEGKLRPFLTLEPDKPTTWPELPKHFWGVEGKRKPGASVLLAAVQEGRDEVNDERGMVVQQSYGLGRIVYVGIDSTWRWRFRVGDTYHHRFWGQIVHGAASDRLLPAGNKFIRYGPRDPVYMDGEAIKLAARLTDALPPLAADVVAKAKLYRQREGKAEELVKEVVLTPKSGQPNLLEAKAPPLVPGIYRMELDIPPYREQIAAPSDDGDKKGLDLFRVLPRENAELLDLATNVPLLNGLAQASGGKVYWPENIDELIERLQSRVERHEERATWKPWETPPLVWWMLGLLVGLLSVEWAWRKWLELV